MKLFNLALIAATASAAEIKEGFECKKGADTCLSNSGAAGQCCNLVTYGIKYADEYTAIQTIATTLCVDTSAKLVKDEAGGSGT